MPGADPLKASLTLVVLSVTGNQDEDNMTDANPTPRVALFVPHSIHEVIFTQFNSYAHPSKVCACPSDADP